MNNVLKTIVILALVFAHLLPSNAQNQDKVKQANNLMQQAGMQLLVHKDYESACSLYEQAANIYHMEYGSVNRKYLEAIKGLADCYDKSGNTKLAIKNYRKLLKSGDIWQNDYVCLQLGRIYQQNGNIDAAIDVYAIGIDNYKNNSGRWNSNYHRIYKELYLLNYNTGNYAEAARVCAELCDIIRIDRQKWIAFSCDLAVIYQRYLGKHLEALKVYHEVLRVYNEGEVANESSIQQYNIAEVLRGIGSSYYSIGNNEKAIDYFVQSYNKYKNVDQPYYKNVFHVLIPLSACYSEVHNADSSIEYAKEACEMAERFDLGKEKNLALMNYANILLSFGKIEEAQTLLNAALYNCRDDGIKAAIFDSMSSVYAEHGKLDQALQFAQSAISLSKHPTYFHNLAILYSKAKDYSKAAQAMADSWELAFAEMRTMFLQNREDDYGHIWSKYKNYIRLPITLLWQSYNAEILKYAYNSLLMTKSIQLATSLRFRSIISNNGDAEMKELYDKWLNTPEDQAGYADIELELLSKVSRLSSSSNVFEIRWNDVRDKLKDGEIAVEFARTDTKEDAYIALILTPESEAPECVFLSIDNTAERLHRDNDLNMLYNSEQTGDLIWRKVIDTAQKSCPEIKTIYFVPDGILHSMPIEYMISRRSRMCDRYEMCRLSSTRDIVVESTAKTSDRSAVLFGGIDYSITVEEMEYYSSSLTQERNSGNFWSYLPGTQEEVDRIEAVLGANSYAIEKHSGASCVEEMFKMYSGNSPEIIHIATHGFYMQDEYAENEDVTVSEGVSLKKCGLAFAGANQSLLGSRNIPDDVEDGILSASEISKLELNNTSLVVLSACQTGLGDINDEGVYGLQRAFKKAGAGSVMMSMWNVDDVVTQSFMTEFYRGLSRGLTKRKALNIAQHYVMKEYGNDPYYWAPFVLVD